MQQLFSERKKEKKVKPSKIIKIKFQERILTIFFFKGQLWHDNHRKTTCCVDVLVLLTIKTRTPAGTRGFRICKSGTVKMSFGMQTGETGKPATCKHVYSIPGRGLKRGRLLLFHFVQAPKTHVGGHVYHCRPRPRRDLQHRLYPVSSR